MLDSSVIKKIEEFVYIKPRSMQEIAEHMQKNWRTADRYIQEIEKEFGTIATRTFREGTRGALKIVYWASVEKASHSIFQEMLEEQIMKGRTKEDFFAFDIFQHIKDEEKEARMLEGISEENLELNELKGLLLSAKKQMLIFSGNLSFANFKDDKIDILKVIEELVKKGISIKVVCRVDLAGKENIDRILSLNFKHRKDLIEIRHRNQPLRAVVIDNKVFNIKEVKEATGRKGELNKKVFIFYTIKNKDWTEWLSRIFWKMFSSSVNARKRIEELNKIKTPREIKTK